MVEAVVMRSGLLFQKWNRIESLRMWFCCLLWFCNLFCCFHFSKLSGQLLLLLILSALATVGLSLFSQKEWLVKPVILYILKNFAALWDHRIINSSLFTVLLFFFTVLLPLVVNELLWNLSSSWIWNQESRRLLWRTRNSTWVLQLRLVNSKKRVAPAFCAILDFACKIVFSIRMLWCIPGWILSVHYL